MIDGEYVLPLRWADDRGLPELVRYLDLLANWIPVTVVDGSGDELFARHARAFPRSVAHVRPEPRPGRNGKVAGVMTGVARARADRVVIADDDVRYTRETLSRVLGILDRAEVVRPQNYFAPLTWHARWDTARSLVNRAFGADYPGTLALRRSTLLDAGGYDGDVLFENLELIRTLRAAGGRECRAADVFVRRLPPTARHFWAQRIRQAYDDFAQPLRFIAEAAIVPVLLAAARRPWTLGVVFAAVLALAEFGRRRHSGRSVFGSSAALWAPLWLVERGTCVWVAVALRLRGGVRYSDGRILRAATPSAVLERRSAVK